MTRLFWVLGAALLALVITRVALQFRIAGKSRQYRLAREYLEEQLTAQGIADKVPARLIDAVAERYAGAVPGGGEVRPLGRLAAASQLMRNIDEAVALIAQRVKEGREIPQSIAEMPLPALEVPDELKEPDIPDADS